LFAFLDLTWKPSSTESTPPVGKAPAIVRGDTYAHTIRITDGWLNGLQDGTFAAQIRTARLSGATAASPLVSFTVAELQDVDDLLVTFSLTSEETLDLPPEWFWDLQTTEGSTVTTLLAGKGRTLDDVTRVA
jgi:hypothetical protein